MSQPKRPTRVRTAVPTYNLKILTGNGKRARKSYRKPRPSMPLNKSTDNASKASTPARQPPRSHSNTSSGLTSPMQSPRLSALRTSLTDVAAASLEQLNSAGPEITADHTSPTPRTTPSPSLLFDCFNARAHPRGHFYSANELFLRGIWIGYLAPDKFNKSFNSLPSFSDLRTNFRRLSPPFPSPVQGVAREERTAVCRGCVGADSAVITLREIQFVQNKKLVIMPLDGDDEAGMFCIMLPQASDISLHGLQAYRPYEHLNDEREDSFTNNFMLLALRDPNRDIGTLETVRALLSTVELCGVERRAAKRPRVNPGDDLASNTSSEVVQKRSPLPAVDQSKLITDSSDNTQEGAPSKRRRREQSSNILRTHSVDQGHSDDDSERLQPERNHGAQAATPRTQQRTPISPGGSEPPPKTQAAITPTQIISHDLSNGPAGRAHIVWMVNDNGLDYEFVHTIDECKTFNGLLGLLQEEAEAIPAIAAILAETKMWRLTYQLADGTKKAVVTRKETEVAFDRLQATLAQSSILTHNSCAKLDIELTALSRPLSSA